MSINGRKYAAHRLAWLYVHIKWPAEYIDHINGIKTDNRIANLREASKITNTWNAKRNNRNRSGFKGVSWHKNTGKWQAQITVNGKYKQLGYYNTALEASNAYLKYSKQMRGEFYNDDDEL